MSSHRQALTSCLRRSLWTCSRCSSSTRSRRLSSLAQSARRLVDASAAPNDCSFTLATIDGQPMSRSGALSSSAAGCPGRQLCELPTRAWTTFTTSPETGIAVRPSNSAWTPSGVPRPLRRVNRGVCMKVVIPGGSGQVGTVLARAFHGDGHEVVVLSRRPDARPWRVIAWDGATLGNWQSEIDGCDVVINLTGRSVNCRYTAANREEILQSRVLSTRVVGQAIATAARKPRVWLQASTATIYAHRYDSPNDEHSGILGGDEPSAQTPGDSASTSRVRGSAPSKKPLPMELERLRFGPQ